MAYGGTAQAHAGRGMLMRRVIRLASAIMANTEAMKSSWPTSTPTLKNSSAIGIDGLRRLGRDFGFDADPYQVVGRDRRHISHSSPGPTRPTASPRLMPRVIPPYAIGSLAVFWVIQRIVDFLNISLA